LLHRPLRMSCGKLVRLRRPHAPLGVFLSMRMIFSENRFPLFGIMRQHAQRSGTNASPSEAGAGLPAQPRHHEIATSTTMVARYGSDDISCDGMPRAVACACS